MSSNSKVKIPQKGKSREDVLNDLRTAQINDLKWQEGKSFCLIYDPGLKYKQLIQEAYNLYFNENALNPTSFPSLRRLEAEVVQMVADLMNGDEKATGSMTSGGTESILMAVKTARDYAREYHPNIREPEIIIPVTAHPAFEKAFHYFGIKPIHAPVDINYRADIGAIDALISDNTIMIVASAPSYPHGVVDPIEEIGALLRDKDILFHVDACIGGFLLPFAKQLGYNIPTFDFTVPQVSSISIDIHKYGYAAKGASVILYRNRSLRKFQFSVYTQWPGGVYGSPAILGSKPGGAIAAAWAALSGIGIEGYCELSEKALEATRKIVDAIKGIKDLELMTVPDMTIIAFTASDINIYEVADELNIKGWNFERLQKPAGIHLTVSQVHLEHCDLFIKDLKYAVKRVQRFSLSQVGNKIQVATIKRLAKILPEGMIAKIQSQFSGTANATSSRTAAMYGMMEVISGEDLDEIVLDLLDKLNSLDDQQ